MISAVVLDFGGVIVRTEDHKGRLELEQKYKLPPGGLHQLVFYSSIADSATIGRAEPDAIWEHVADKLSLSPDELNLFIQSFWAGDNLDEELIQFLKSCRPHYKTAILSNAWNNLREALAETYHIVEGQTVDHILISAELGVAKPDPKIYKILADTLGCQYHEILFVDDFIENIQAAKSLGIQTIHYQPNLDLINEIKSMLESS
jgi:putative hydrolase of the HAD superfamily